MIDTYPSAKTLLDIQARMTDAVIEAADESAKRTEAAVRETATAFANAYHAQVERSIDALTIPAKLRAKSVAIAREALAQNTPAAK